MARVSGGVWALEEKKNKKKIFMSWLNW